MSVRRSSPRRHALAAAILLGLSVPAVALAQSDGQASSDPEPKTLDKVTVTGSRIKRTDVEAALPVTIIQKQEIEAQGITSAEQLLQFLNIAGNGSDGLTSAAVDMDLGELRGTAGVSGANLRGQGSDATLVLLNGRRVATHGLRGQAVDLNSIPFAAIDRVEVLRDGASAVYGTDAIGGVINFITRTDYRGITVNAGVDLTQDGGGAIHNYSVLGGVGDLDTDRWNAWATVWVAWSWYCMASPPSSLDISLNRSCMRCVCVRPGSMTCSCSMVCSAGGIAMTWSGAGGTRSLVGLVTASAMASIHPIMCRPSEPVGRRCKCS